MACISQTTFAVTKHTVHHLLKKRIIVDGENIHLKPAFLMYYELFDEKSKAIYSFPILIEPYYDKKMKKNNYRLFVDKSDIKYFHKSTVRNHKSTNGLFIKDVCKLLESCDYLGHIVLKSN